MPAGGEAENGGGAGDPPLRGRFPGTEDPSPEPKEAPVGEINKVVAHYVTGKIVKGTTQDFFPNRPSFHLQPVTGGAAEEIRIKDLKAVFFVKDYVGVSTRKDLRGFVAAPAETSQGKKIAVRFQDGELFCGFSLSYSPERIGFFMFPADPGSNNLRVFVVRDATASIKVGSAADALAERAMARSKAA
jgi:Family of unknown function (DUF6982)